MNSPAIPPAAPRKEPLVPTIDLARAMVGEVRNGRRFDDPIELSRELCERIKAGDGDTELRTSILLQDILDGAVEFAYGLKKVPLLGFRTNVGVIPSTEEYTFVSSAIKDAADPVESANLIDAIVRDCWCRAITPEEANPEAFVRILELGRAALILFAARQIRLNQDIRSGATTDTALRNLRIGTFCDQIVDRLQKIEKEPGEYFDKKGPAINSGAIAARMNRK